METPPRRSLNSGLSSGLSRRVQPAAPPPVASIPVPPALSLSAPSRGVPGPTSGQARALPDADATRQRLIDKGAVSEDEEAALLRRMRQRITDAALERGVDPHDANALRDLAIEVAGQVLRGSDSKNRLQRDRLVAEVLSYIGSGYGPLQPLLAIPGIEEIMINRHDEVWIAVSGQPKERLQIQFRDEDDVEALVQRLAAEAGRQFNFREPIVDARLPDGNRLNAIRHGVSARGHCVTIRVHKPEHLRPTVEQMVKQGMLPRRDHHLNLFGSEQSQALYDPNMDVAEFLRLCVRQRVTMLFVGPTGTGKTTVMDAFLREIPALLDPSMRIVTVEDVVELSDCVPNVVRLQARHANSEGVGLVTMDDLVRAALRMRPDIIVVGEVRGIEGASFIVALNTGHEGSMTCIHAQSPRAALNRLEGLLRSGTDFDERLCREFVSALQLIVQIGRDGRHDDMRSLREVAALDGYDSGGDYRITPLYTWRNGCLVPTGQRPAWAAQLSTSERNQP